MLCVKHQVAILYREGCKIRQEQENHLPKLKKQYNWLNNKGNYDQ